MRWEELNPAGAKLLVTLAQDTKMTTDRLAQAMLQQGCHISPSSVNPVLIRLGVRQPSATRPKRKAPRDVTAELDAARAKVAELEAVMACQQISFQLSDEMQVEELACLADRTDVVVVYGVTPQFHRLGGMSKLLEFVKRYVPQTA
jgi:hypothetical protein